MNEDFETSASDQAHVTQMETRRTAATRIGCFCLVIYLVMAWGGTLLLPAVMPRVATKFLLLAGTTIFVYLAYRWNQSSSQHGIVFLLSVALATGTAIAILLI